MTLFDPAWLIHVGTALLLIGYFIRDELKLRIMIIISSAVFNFYYWLVPQPPLWDAVLTGFLMIAVNLYVLTQVLLDRTTFRLSAEEKQLFTGFETLSPGQFRKVLKLARWRSSTGVDLTRQDERVARLFYIFDGIIEVQKDGRRFRLPPGNFVGEVAFVLDDKASATTHAPPGVRYVGWDCDALRALGQRHPALGNALNALLTRDLARKLGDSYRPEDALPAIA